jgi:phosphoribosylaminoimidazole carboxylase (NCAIR synthetase)
MIIANPIYDIETDRLIEQIKERLLRAVADDEMRTCMRIEDELARTYYKDLRAKDEIIEQKDEIIIEKEQVIVETKQELKQTKQELVQKEQVIEQTKQELVQKEQELLQKEQELAQLRFLLEPKNK